MNPAHNPRPHWHPPGTTWYGGAPMHRYQLVRRFGIRRLRCWCGLSPCPDAEQEAINRAAEVGAVPRTPLRWWRWVAVAAAVLAAVAVGYGIWHG